MTCSYYAQGWPIFSALHASGSSGGPSSALSALSAVASLATVALGVGIIQAMIRVLSAPPVPARLAEPALTA